MERTCSHYEVLLDELPCEPHNTPHKHRQRAGLAKLKSTMQAILTTAFQSKNALKNNDQQHNDNSQKQDNKNIHNHRFAHLGVHSLQNKYYSLEPIQPNESLHVNLSNVVKTTNTFGIPSTYYKRRVTNIS